MSVDAHVQCHCQIGRSCPAPHRLSPATALEHARRQTRTEVRVCSKQPRRKESRRRDSLPPEDSNVLQLLKTLNRTQFDVLFAVCDGQVRRDWLLLIGLNSSNNMMLNVGYAPLSSSYMLGFVFFFRPTAISQSTRLIEC